MVSISSLDGLICKSDVRDNNSSSNGNDVGSSASSKENPEQFFSSTSVSKEDFVLSNLRGSVLLLLSCRLGKPKTSGKFVECSLCAAFRRSPNHDLQSEK